MSVKAFVYIIFSWLLLIAISGAVDGFMTGRSDLANVLSMNVLEMKQVFFLSIPWPRIDWVASAWSLATWNFSFFAGNAQWVRFFLGMLITGMLFWGFISNVLPTLVQGAAALASVLNAINPFKSG